MSIQGFFEFLQNNQLIILIIATHFFVFHLGLSISDRTQVIASLLSWYLSFKTSIKHINTLSRLDYIELCENHLVVALTMLAGREVVSTSDIKLINLSNKYKKSGHEENINQIELVLNRSLRLINMLKKKRTLSYAMDFSTKLLKDSKENSIN